MVQCEGGGADVAGIEAVKNTYCQHFERWAVAGDSMKLIVMCSSSTSYCIVVMSVLCWARGGHHPFASTELSPNHPNERGVAIHHIPFQIYCCVFAVEYMGYFPY
jgi:hypothetical protein